MIVTHLSIHKISMKIPTTMREKWFRTNRRIFFSGQQATFTHIYLANIFFISTRENKTIKKMRSEIWKGNFCSLETLAQMMIIYMLVSGKNDFSRKKNMRKSHTKISRARSVIRSTNTFTKSVCVDVEREIAFTMCPNLT